MFFFPPGDNSTPRHSNVIIMAHNIPLWFKLTTTRGGVSHSVALPFTLKPYLNAKEKL